MQVHHYSNPQEQILNLRATLPSRGLITINASIHPQTTPETDGLAIVYPPGAEMTPEECKDFPVLTAKVTAHQISGYGAIFGWIQLVRSTDDEDIWKMDPIPILSGLNTPFCYLGCEPTLFDAPTRLPKGNENIDWTAHAFLCVMGMGLLDRRVSVVAGFEWGFKVLYGEEEKRKVLVKKLLEVDVEEAWKEKLSVLRGQYKGWVFEEEVLGSV